MTTRDSKAWWFVIAAAIVTAVSSRLDLIDPLIPESHTKQVHALIELAALIVGIVAGVMRMSPLPISESGRAEAIEKKVKSADTAAVAAAVAADASSQAAEAASVAVEAAKVASVESTKAADTVDE